MKKKLSTAVVATVLLASASLAGAAEMTQLSDAQMDGIAAGAQHSTATGSASALYGTVSTTVTTAAVSSGPLRTTQAGALSVAFGFGSTAATAAQSSF